jgi:hypothetical protein
MKFADRDFSEVCGSTIHGSILRALGVAVDGKSAASALGRRNS